MYSTKRKKEENVEMAAKIIKQLSIAPSIEQKSLLPSCEWNSEIPTQYKVQLKSFVDLKPYNGQWQYTETCHQEQSNFVSKHPAVKLFVLEPPKHCLCGLKESEPFCHLCEGQKSHIGGRIYYDRRIDENTYAVCVACNTWGTGLKSLELLLFYHRMCHHNQTSKIALFEAVCIRCNTTYIAIRDPTSSYEKMPPRCYGCQKFVNVRPKKKYDWQNLILMKYHTGKNILEHITWKHNEINHEVEVCRFCGEQNNVRNYICDDKTCTKSSENACSQKHSCGHICGGVVSEKSCLPCLFGCGVIKLKQNFYDPCQLCTDQLSRAPAIQLQCGHVFHLHCCRTVLTKKWVGPRITFSFSLCRICKVPMDNPNLMEQLASVKVLYEDVKRKSLMRLEYEGLDKADEVTAPGSRYYQEPATYAMDRYAYYVCYKCKKAYYGGEARCDVQQAGDVFDPTELVCSGCSNIARAQMCSKHGNDFLEYKCRYCCSVAVFFCFGTTHLCMSCHNFPWVANLPKNELPTCPAGPKAEQLEGNECPLHFKHPPTGEEFALGCSICRKTSLV